VLDPDKVDRAEEAVRVADRLREAGERSGVIVQVNPQRGAERGRRMRCGLAHGHSFEPAPGSGIRAPTEDRCGFPEPA
jgi:hypothetical protein